MTWNYRVIQHEDYCGLHELYYDDGGVITGYTEALVVGNDLDDLRGTLELMLQDASNRGVLDEELLPPDIGS